MRRLNAKSHIGKGPAVAWRGRWPGPESVATLLTRLA
jgi:hypothetical protein